MLPATLLLATVGLVVAVLAVAAASVTLLGFAPLVAVLFGVIVMPTDPVSVLAVLDRVGAPERLTTLIEGESLVNDGVAVVLFGAVLALVERGADPSAILTPGGLAGLAGSVLLTAAGGAAVGFVAGYGVYRTMATLDDHMTEIVLTVVLAYGSFLLAEHYLGASGVIATVVAGLLLGNRGREHAMSARTKTAVFNTWETAAYLVNTFIFVLLGVATPVTDIVENAGLILPVIGLVLIARAVAVYPLVPVADRLARADLDATDAHALVWGGLHGSIPIALVLGLPASVPNRSQLNVLVFGVVAFSLVVQGLTMDDLLRWLDVETTDEAEVLYELLLARARAVDAALDAADRLAERNAIRESVHERFEREYGAEKADLAAATAGLLEAEPSLHRRETLAGERRVLAAEESAITEAELDGLVSTETADELVAEIREKRDRTRRGKTTVTSSEEREGYEEFWRRRARAFGLLDGDAEPPPTAGGARRLTSSSPVYSSPFVLGVPTRRSSIRVASSSARASALKSASISWWAFSPSTSTWRVSPALVASDRAKWRAIPLVNPPTRSSENSPVNEK